MAKRHYTDEAGRQGIERLGLITPSLDGLVYLTPDSYDSGTLARERLALSRTPTGYFEVPDERLIAPSKPRSVRPHGAMAGGGTEVHVDHPIDATALQWYEVTP